MLIIKCRQGVTCDSDTEMNKSWMQEPTRSDRYIKCVKEFVRIVRQCMNVNGIKRCLCRDCANRYFCHIEVVESHLYDHGIDLTYTRWIFHGEDLCSINVTSNLHIDTNVRIEGG
jgi:hypothetical protein